MFVAEGKSARSPAATAAVAADTWGDERYEA